MPAPIKDIKKAMRLQAETATMSHQMRQRILSVPNLSGTAPRVRMRTAGAASCFPKHDLQTGFVVGRVFGHRHFCGQFLPDKFIRPRHKTSKCAGECARDFSRGVGLLAQRL